MAEIKGSMDKNLLINLKKELIKLPEKAEEILAQESQVKLCARKYANAKNFVYIAAFGAFTEVSYMTSQDKKNILGHQAYILESVKHLASLKSHRM